MCEYGYSVLEGTETDFTNPDFKDSGGNIVGCLPPVVADLMGSEDSVSRY